jgi:hypothetical protein
LTNSSTSESTQVRKTVSFSKKRDKDLIDLEELKDDFSYNAKELMRDGLRFRQLMQSQTITLNPLNVVPMIQTTEKEHYIEKNETIKDEPEEIEQETRTSNIQDFLNSKTKKAELTEDDKKRLEENLDF